MRPNLASLLRPLLGLALWVAVGFWGCAKPPAPNPDPIDLTPAEGAFLLNEGGFNYGNASVSYYDFAAGAVQHDLFARANGRPLGDVLQSMACRDGECWLVLNNSGRIEVVDAADFKLRHSITGLVSPRYVAFSPDGAKAYVSDLYGQRLAVVDVGSHAVVGQVPLRGWSEEMCVVAGRWLMVANRQCSHVYMVDTDTDAVVDSLPVAPNPNALVPARDGRVWVLCSGDEALGQPGGLFLLHPGGRQVERTLRFTDYDMGAWPRLGINSAQDTLYYLKGDLFALPVSATALPGAPVVAAQGRTLYGLGVEPVRGRLWLADAKDYQQRGRVYVYDARGTLLWEVGAGVIPNGFGF